MNDDYPRRGLFQMLPSTFGQHRKRHRPTLRERMLIALGISSPSLTTAQLSAMAEAITEGFEAGMQDARRRLAEQQGRGIAAMYEDSLQDVHFARDRLSTRPDQEPRRG